jgi:hypothetical protein
MSVCLVVSWAAQASAGRVEVTPFAGYTFGGKFEEQDTDEEFEISDTSSWGGIVNIDLSGITQLELFYSRQETELTSGGLFPTDKLFDMDVEYFHVGGTYLLGPDQWQPFVVGTLGLTHMSPEPSEVRSLNRFSLGIGGGVKYFPIERLGLYLAGRGLITFIDSTLAYSTGEEGGTIYFGSDALWQFQLNAGLIFAF